MLKLSKTGITVLKRQYKSVLMKCLLINAGIMFAAGAANAETPWANAISGTDTFMDNLASSSSWDRDDGVVTGWGVDQILATMAPAATATDNAITLVNDASKGNEALYSKVNTIESDLNTAEGKITSLETSVGTKADTSTVTALTSRVSAAEGNITDLQTNKADKSTVNTLAGRVTTLEGAGYQNATQVSNAIDTALGSYSTTAQMNSAISTAVSSKANASDVTALQTTVGNASSGLVKDVADLQGTVGNASSGLVKDVTDLKNNTAGYQTATQVSDAITASLTGTGTGTIGKAISDAQAAAQTAAQTSILAGTGYTGSGLEDVVENTADAQISASLTGTGTGTIGKAISDAQAAAQTAALSALEAKLDDGATGYDIDAKSLKVQGTSVATASDITSAIEALDATATQAASTTNPLSLTVTQADGVITGISGSVAVDGTSIVVNSAGKLEVGSVDVADISTTNYDSSALKSSVVGTKVNSATAADSATTLTGLNSTVTELNELHGSGVVATDLTKLHNVTATATELNVLDGIEASTAELNKLHGVTASTTQINYLSGVTSDIQTQLDGKTTLTAVVEDAQNTTGTHLGAVIKGTKVDNAASADSAKAVTSDALSTDGSLVLDGGKLKVGSITHANVSDFDTQVEADIAASINTSGKALNTALAAKVNNADNFTASTNSDLIKNKTVVAAIQDTAAQVDVNTAKNGTQDTSIGNLYSAINGGTYAADTGTVTGGASLSGFTAGNLTAAANELMTDITITSGQVTAANHLTAGENLAGNVVAVANALSSTEAVVGTPQAVAATTGILNGYAINGNGDDNSKTVIQAIDYVAKNAAGLAISNVFTGATNTFGNTANSQVIIDNGGGLTANTSLKVGTDEANMLSVSSAGTVIGAANAITGTEGALNMGGNSLNNVHGLTLTDGTGHTNDATISVTEAGINTGNKSFDVGTGSLNAQTLNVGSSDQFQVKADGSLETSGSAKVGSLAIGTTGKGFDDQGNLTAGTIKGTGIDTTAENTVKLGGTGYTTEVTGNMTVSGDSTFGSATGKHIAISEGGLTIATGSGDSNVTASIKNNGDASFKNTSVDGTLGVTGLASLNGGVDVNGKFAVSATDGTITMTNGANSATMAITDIKVATDDPSNPEPVANVIKVTGTGLFTGDVASEKGFIVAQKNGVDQYEVKYSVDQNGNINSKGTLSVSDGKFAVDSDGAVDAANGAFSVDKDGNTTVGDTTNYVKLNADGTLETSGAATIGNGLTVSAGGADITGDSSVDGKLDVTGDFSVATNKFTVASDTGNTAVAGTMDIEGDTTIGDKFSVKATDGSFRAAGGEFIVDGSGNTRIKGALGAGANGTEFGVGSDGSVKAAKGKFNVDANGATQAESLAFNSDGATVLVNKIDQGAAAITDGDATTTARLQTMATNATVAKTIGNLKGIRYEDDGTTVKPASHGVTNVDDVASAISSLATNVETATGGTFTDAVWKGTIKADNAPDYTYGGTVGYANIMNAVSTVASNVGAAVSNTYNGVEATATVNANIDAVNAKIGDWANLHKDYVAGASIGNAITNGGENVPTTVVGAMNNIDATLGTIHGLAAKLEAAGTYQGNLADGTTVEQHLTALDAAIGDRSRFANTHYAKDAESVVDAIDKLDTGLYDLDHDVRRLRHHFEAGMASAAALSALQPNARATGNTQLAIGSGSYRGHGAMAIGGFHWFTDNLLFNAGVAYDSNEPTYRMGVTYSW